MHQVIPCILGLMYRPSTPPKTYYRGHKQKTHWVLFQEEWTQAPAKASFMKTEQTTFTLQTGQIRLARGGASNTVGNGTKCVGLSNGIVYWDLHWYMVTSSMRRI